jgi:Class II Aldolase and Adducin N-terminal domain
VSEGVRHQLSSLCQQVGAGVPWWTQGAGGNISIKEKDRLWIKATGSRLDGVTLREGIAQVDLSWFRRALNSLPEDLMAAESKYSQVLRESALFWEHSKPILRREKSGEYLFPESLVIKERNLGELWLATQLIYEMCPDFPEVSPAMKSTIQNLPAELVRKLVVKS